MRHRHGAPALHADPGHDGGRERRAGVRAAQGRAARRATRPSRACASCPSASASSVDPRALVEDIGVGQQQRVEILRVLHRGADVLILDEPTAVLTAQEIAELFKVLRALTAEGVSVIFITHKLREVLEIADRVTVLRRGKKIDTVETEGATEASLAKLMVGRDVLFRVEKEAAQAGDPLLEVDGARGRGRPRAARACAGSRCRCAAARSSASPGSTATASPSWSRRSPGCACRRAGSVRVGGEDITGARRARRAGRRRRPHRRGPPPARPHAGLHAGGEPRPARVPARAAQPLRPALAEAHGAAGAAAARAVRRARRPAGDDGRLALGRQPAEGA